MQLFTFFYRKLFGLLRIIYVHLFTHYNNERYKKMETNTIPQKNDIRHKSIAHLLPFGGQAELANQFDTSRTYVNAVVRGMRIDNKVYAAALLMAAEETNARQTREQMNQQAQSLAEILLR